MKDCIFCKIIQGSIPADKVYEDEQVICFRDIQPQAKIHLLVIPKKHVASLEIAFSKDHAGGAQMMGMLFEKSTLIAKSEGLLPGGYRTVINTNQNGGQTVFHLHLHLLGGEPLTGRFA